MNADSKERYELACGCRFPTMRPEAKMNDDEANSETIKVQREKIAQLESELFRINTKCVDALAAISECSIAIEGYKQLHITSGTMEAPHLLSDGFGMSVSPICEKCGRNAVQILRPGDARCAFCD